MATPSERTVQLLRKLGWIVARVERDMARPAPDPLHPGKVKMMYWKADLFGLADYIAFGHNRVLLIQCTNAGNHANHVTKISENPITKQWAANGQETVLFGWKPEAKTQPRVTIWRGTQWAEEVPALTCLIGNQSTPDPQAVPSSASAGGGEFRARISSALAAIAALGWSTHAAGSRLMAFQGSDLYPVRSTGWHRTWEAVLQEVQEVEREKA